jgi:hypothetical protein
MKAIHHAKAEIYHAHKLNYRTSHFIDLPDGYVLVVGDAEQAYLDAFELEPGTTALPFILSGEVLPPVVVASLAHLGITETDNTMQACLKLRTRHSAFNPSQL